MQKEQLQVNDIKLIHGDCIGSMELMDDGIIDLTVTSPPYDNLRTYDGSLQWNEDIWKQVIKQLYRITKDGGVVVWVVGDATIKGSETGTSFKQALYAMECGFSLHDTMIYEKTGISFPDKTRYQSAFEYMFVFGKGKLRTINLITDRPNKQAGNQSYGKDRNASGLMKKKSGYGKTIREFGVRWNIWSGMHNNRFTGHPAPFPIQLVNDHILSWSNPGDTIFDPFMGSGTAGIAAIGLDRSFIGIEKVDKYYTIASDRINQAQSDKQQELF